MKKKKVIRRLKEAKRMIDLFADKNKRGIVAQDLREKVLAEVGINVMNISAKSVIDGMIWDLQGKKTRVRHDEYVVRNTAEEKDGVTYGGFVTMDEETELKPAEDEKHEEGES